LGYFRRFWASFGLSFWLFSAALNPLALFLSLFNLKEEYKKGTFLKMNI